MKRTLNIESTNNLPSFSLPKAASLASNNIVEQSWSLVEDQALIQLATKVKYRKWITVSKQMNFQFQHVKRSPKECQLRWKMLHIKDEEEKQWASSEESILIYALYHTEDLESIANSLPTKNIDQIRKHLCATIKEFISYSKKTTEWTEAKVTPLEIWKTFFYCNLVLQHLGKEECKLPGIIKEIAETQIKEKEILEFVNAITKDIGIEHKWTTEDIKIYVNNMIEKLENRLCSTFMDTDGREQEEDPFAEILHLEQMPLLNIQSLPQSANEEGDVFFIFTIVHQPNP